MECPAESQHFPRLIEHKKALTSVDHELFEILSRQAAMALHSAASRSQRPTVRPPRRPQD